MHGRPLFPFACWLLMLGAAFPCRADDAGWQPKRSPQQVGRQVIGELLSRDRYMMYETDHFNGIHYAEAASALGALRLLDRTGNEDLQREVIDRYREVPGAAHLEQADHVDASVWGVVPLQLFLVSGERARLREGLALADAQWAHPDNAGLSQQTRFWIDDIWMINSLQVQAYRTTGKIVYLDRAARETVAYLERLQQDNGLFFHGPDAPFFWGRGNGWVAAGLAELVAVLPESHPEYATVVDAYTTMMAALVDNQADDGMWRQLIDRSDAWKESSSTAMFGYALAVGVDRGILVDPVYTMAFQAAWDALVTRIDSAGRLQAVCVGTGQSRDVDYYLQRPAVSGDLHGQAPLLWFAAVLVN